MKLIFSVPVFFACAALLFCSGCANHLQDIDSVTQENERKILNTKFELKLSPQVIRDSSYNVEIRKLESAEIKKYEVRTLKTLETPYQWWREFYEIPTSFVLLPVSITTHVFFVATFGILPYKVPCAITDLAFTGLNPALNWESESRKEERLVSITRKMLSSGTENLNNPLSRETVVVRSGEKSASFQTDEFGTFALNFIDVNHKNTFFPTARKLSFHLESGQELKRVILTRDFLAKLMWARTRINSYLMKPSGKKLFDTVIYLEKNGFELLAYMLEESELAKYRSSRQFQTDFQEAVSQK